MGIQNWSETIILVKLAQEPQLGDELQNVFETIQEKGEVDVVIDFADVDIITSSSIAKLLRIRKALVDCGHRMVLSSLKPRTQQVFSVTGLDGVFDFVGDQFLALAGIQLVNN